MAYKEALEAAGATVHAFQEFGSYQGDWWAKVTLADGRAGWINGGYGSCSGCDSFEAEFGYEDEKCEDHRYDSKSPTCAACDSAKVEHIAKLARFGAGYLDGLMSNKEAEAQATKNIEWDADAEDMAAFIRSESAKAADAVDPVAAK